MIKLIQAYTIGGGGGPGGELLKIGGLLVRLTSTKTVLFKASFGTSWTAWEEIQIIWISSYIASKKSKNNHFFELG